MKFSREWLGDFLDLNGLSDDELGERFTAIGHAVEMADREGDDTVFELEITANRVDAMSHLGMARELAAALGRELQERPAPPPPGTTGTDSASAGGVTIRIEAPEMCPRFSAVLIRNVAIRPSPAHIQRRLSAVGLRPISNVVDATNYVMLELGHPLHAYDLSKVRGQTLIVRRGADGEVMKSLDGEKRRLDVSTVVIADAEGPTGLGGIIGGEDSEISATTRDVLLECAFFDPSVIRRTARRLGVKTDASYRFERRVDPEDTLATLARAAALIAEWSGGTAEPAIDVRATSPAPKTLVLRTKTLHTASAGAVGAGYALELFRRLGFAAEASHDGVRVTVPPWRGDIHEEMDLVEEVLRFFGLNNVPAELPRMTTGDVRPNVFAEAEDAVRTILVGCGLSEAITYSFVSEGANAMFSSEQAIVLTNSLSENIAAMRVSLIPGLLEAAAFNRSYGNRDGGLFEVGRTYHRDGSGVREARRAAILLFGSEGAFWGDAKRPYDFYDLKGLVDQVAAKFHVALEYGVGDHEFLRAGKRAVARHGDRPVATLGFISAEVLSRFGMKGEVAAAEIAIDALLDAASDWRMAPVARFPGVPMILAMTHGRDLPYQKIIQTVRSLDVPHLHEVGLRDRFVADSDPDSIKTTLGMWYQAFDRSLTQDEVSELHQSLASRLAAMLPVQLLH